MSKKGYNLAENFWQHIESYKENGFDPLNWLGSCNSELDQAFVRQAARDVKKAGIKITPSWFDAFYHVDGKTPELTRRVYDLGSPAVGAETHAKRALAIFRVARSQLQDPHQLTAVLQQFFDAFSAKLAVSSISVTPTEHDSAQFAMLDYIELHRGDKAGFMPAVTSVTRLTDVLRTPDSEVHSSIALTSAIDSLNLLGCGVSSSFKIFPAYDAPSEQMLDTIRANLDAYTSKYNLAWEDYSSLKRGKLFFATTAMATTPKELPVRYDLVEEGMQILVTSKFGGLLALTLHTLGRMDSENIIKYEQNSVQYSKIVEASEAAIKNLSQPHFALGKIVSKYCPDFGAPFQPDSHLATVQPVGPSGILALADLAESVNAAVAMSADLPIIDPEIATFATREFLVENSTASLNGCHLMVGKASVISLVEEDLRKHNFSPTVIGSVGKKGLPSVGLDSAVAGRYIASKPKLARLQPPAPAPV